MEGQGLLACGSGELQTKTGLAGARQPRQHSLDFDRNTVAINKHYPAGDRQIVGKDLDLVRLGSIQFDDGAAAQPHYLVDGHRGGAKHHHEVDTDFIEGGHFETAKLGLDLGLNYVVPPDHVMVSQWLMTAKASI